MRISNNVLIVFSLCPGFLQNNDEPMHIADICDKDNFIGCIDEVNSINVYC